MQDFADDSSFVSGGFLSTNPNPDNSNSQVSALQPIPAATSKASSGAVGGKANDQEEKPQSDPILCSVCNIYCNSENTFKSHVNGARHKKNVKNVATGAPILAVKRRSGVGTRGKAPARCKGMLDSILDPVIGLEYVTEYQKEDPSVEQRYICDLCESKMSMNNLRMHIVGIKHRINYLEKNYPDYFKECSNTELKRSESSEKACAYAKMIEEEKGRSEINVKIEFDPFYDHNKAKQQKMNDQKLKDQKPFNNQNSSSRGRGGGQARGRGGGDRGGKFGQSNYGGGKGSFGGGKGSFGGGQGSYGGGKGSYGGGQGSFGGGQGSYGGGKGSYDGGQGSYGSGQGGGRGGSKFGGQSFGRGGSQSSYSSGNRFMADEQDNFGGNRRNESYGRGGYDERPYYDDSYQEESGYDDDYYGPSSQSRKRANLHEDFCSDLPPKRRLMGYHDDRNPEPASRLRSLCQEIVELGPANLILTEDDAAVALQVSNALTQALLQFRLKTVPTELLEKADY